MVQQLVAAGVVRTGAQVAVSEPHGMDAIGWLVVEERDSDEDRRCAVIGAFGDVHSVGLISTVRVYLQDHDGPMPCWARGVAAAAWERQRAQEALERERQRLGAERQLWADRLETAHQWANDRRHCSEYEEIMELLGLPGRERDYVMDVSVNLNVRVRATASSSDSATSELTHRDIAAAIDELTRRDIADAINDHTVDNVEEG
ncbi:hypothetical protein [Mycobacterium sp. 1245111.1]|uniref:hypothetical protein n=1 Tax=Mycobacterium sp. 1245111.1 TaxID=1834073 RepID=UPI0012EA3AC6|nr:hypothetical protein [Mycobacterium sp. 1245111.1]